MTGGLRSTYPLKAARSFLARAEYGFRNAISRRDGSVAHVMERPGLSRPDPALIDLFQTGAARDCLILGSGPAAATVSLSPAVKSRFFVMSLNRAFVLCTDAGFNPDAVVLSNPHAMREYGMAAAASAECCAFLSSAASWEADLCPADALFFDQWAYPGMDQGWFQFDCSRALYHASSVAHAALQIAVWMRFRTVCFLGVDFMTGSASPHAYVSSPAEKARSARVFSRNAKRMAKGMQEAKRLLDERPGLPFVFRTGSVLSNNPFPYLPWQEALK